MQGPRLQIQGDRQSGQDVRSQNVLAVSAIANIVKSSLGPVGLDKVGMARMALLVVPVLCPIAAWERATHLTPSSTHADARG